MNIVYNIDCMIGMKQYPDKYFNLAIVDPPYGIGNFNMESPIKKIINGSMIGIILYPIKNILQN